MFVKIETPTHDLNGDDAVREIWVNPATSRYIINDPTSDVISIVFSEGNIINVGRESFDAIKALFELKG